MLALDPAKRTGFAHGRPRDIPLLGTIDLGREHDVYADVFGRAARWFGRILDENRRVALIVIEPPIPPGEIWGKSNYGSLFISHGLYAVFAGMAIARKLDVLDAPVRTWRKYFLGNGNMKRDAAKLAAVRLCRQLKWDAPDDNAAEAAGIWAWGSAQVMPQVVRRIEPLFVGGPQ